MKKIIGFFSIILLIISCSHSHTNTGINGHSHPAPDKERAAVAVTLFSDNLEIFTEYQVLQEGLPSDFLIHVTRLDSAYSAFAGGSVEVVLSMDEKEMLVDAEPASVDGIYSASLTPAEAGEGKLVFIVNKGSVKETIPAGTVRIYDRDEEVAIGSGNESGLIKFTKEQAWKSNFNVIRVKSDYFSRSVKTSGEFLSMPGEKQHIAARIQGIMIFGPRGLVQGSYVEKGEVLFTISDKGLFDNNITVQYNRAKVNFDKSRTDFLRHEKLYHENVISEKQFIDTRGRYLNDSILYFSYKESMGSTGMKVIAPMSGYLHELNVSESEFVQPGQLLATISTNQVILLRADVPQQYYDLLKDITTANFRPAYSSRIYSVDELSGRLLAKGASVAENNHYIPVYFEVVNDGSLLEGAFAEIYLKTEPEPGHVVIPVSAMLEELGNYFVYVQVSGEEFRKRRVTAIATDGEYASVGSGLEPGERIVSEGVMLIKTAASSTLPSHGHSH